MRQITISVHPPNASFNVSGELVIFWCSGILCRQTYFSMHSIVHNYIHVHVLEWLLVVWFVCNHTCNSFHVTPRM